LRFSQISDPCAGDIQNHHLFQPALADLEGRKKEGKINEI
jgi:hypothetical protein